MKAIDGLTIPTPRKTISFLIESHCSDSKIRTSAFHCNMTQTVLSFFETSDPNALVDHAETSYN
jgi:hypothetical protein